MCIRDRYKVGYRHFDTAQVYENEDVVGKALKELFDEGVKREDIFVTTKTFILKGQSLIEKLKESLKKLNLEYIDLYLVHWPFVGPTLENNELVLQHMPIHQAWSEMEQCVDQKLAKSIGVSNFNSQSLLDLLSYCKIKPVVNQIELHPYLAQEGLLDLCERFHIHVTAYSPLARNDAKQLFGNPIDLFKDPVIIKLAEKYKKSPAQICLRYLIEKKVSVIPKTEKVERVSENFNIFWEEGLTAEEIKELNQLNKDLRTVTPKLVDAWQNIDAFA
eukprot:TRINITY_DN1329_c0_g1_i2.p1 TRINITY_DN1329_c0_g1~~TRINITY_DN1329_c0_g1_i2.p1  ORF type:complete len:275 (-),score=47.43 TRINITY_DN1329_c0_g1_i2:79-903(-)